MSINPVFPEGSPPEQWNDDNTERATAIALGPEATQRMPNYRYLCSQCDRIVSTSKIIQSNLPDSGLIYDGPPAENFLHYKSFRELVHSAMRGCHLCSLLHTRFHGLPGFSYYLVVRQNVPNVEITVWNGNNQFGSAQLPSIYRTDERALDGLIRSFKTDSDETFACAATWLSTCVRQHDMCSINSINRQFNGFHPQRLLKVSIVNSELSVRLATPHDYPRKIEYLTLSYCWGEAEGLELTKERLFTFSERIPLESLPKTFLDAVVVTARLRYQYIWIASLCIIQDCPRDREMEINSMGDIYKNSVCTIAALSASNCHEGCFVSRDPLKCDHYQSKGESFLLQVQGPETLPGPDCVGHHRPSLNTRAWAVQERAMSPRTLYYGSDMIYWECIKCRALECQPEMQDFERPDEGWLRLTSGKKNGFKRLLEKSRSNPYNSWKYAWRSVLSDYSACELSRDDDKWSAIQGLATEVELYCGDKLLAGLWHNHLREELLWFANGPGPGKALETQELQAPSWSWISINGRVQWLETFNAAFPHNLLEWTAIISAPANAGPSFQPATNSIIVEAPLVNLADIIPSRRGPPDLNPQSEHPNVSSVSWFPDTPESIDISPKWALQFARNTRISSPPNRQFTTYCGLVISELEDSPGTWVRLGLYKITWVQKDFRDSESAPELGTTESIILV